MVCWEAEGALGQDLLLEVSLWEDRPLQRAHFSHIRSLLLGPESQTCGDSFLLSGLCPCDFEAPVIQALSLFREKVEA